jgi:hypothetical protein
MARARIALEIGQRFGRWTVVGRPTIDRGGDARCLVRCACGTVARVRATRLVSGEAHSCGCWKRSWTRPELRLNLHGRQIGDLVVVGTVPNVPWPSGRSPMGRTAWLCQCACGRRIVVPTMHLTRKRNPLRNYGAGAIFGGLHGAACSNRAPHELPVAVAASQGRDPS